MLITFMFFSIIDERLQDPARTQYSRLVYTAWLLPCKPFPHTIVDGLKFLLHLESDFRRATLNRVVVE